MNWKGKPLSLAAKLLAVIFVLISFVLKALGIFTGVTITDIALIGGLLILAFCPVDISLILEQVKAIALAKFTRTDPTSKGED